MLTKALQHTANPGNDRSLNCLISNDPVDQSKRVSAALRVLQFIESIMQGRRMFRRR
jgi:hypothetical protein